MAIFDLVIDTPAMLEAIKQSRNESEANMSDESGQGEPPEEKHTDWWGDPISAERQAELDTWAAQQRTWAEQPEATQGESPLKGVELTGAEVFWLATRALAGPEGDAIALAAVRSLDFTTDLSTLHLKGATLIGAQLQGANLQEAYLEGADLSGAQLDGTTLTGAFLDAATDVSTAMWTALKDTMGPQLADVR